MRRVIKETELPEECRMLPVKDRKNYIKIKNIIINLEDKSGLIPIQKIIQKAKEIGIADNKEVSNVLENYKRSGEIYEPEKGLLKRI